MLTQVTETEETVVPGHHKVAMSAFTWDDLTATEETVVPGHHKVAMSAFTWDDAI